MKPCIWPSNKAVASLYHVPPPPPLNETLYFAQQQCRCVAIPCPPLPPPMNETLYLAQQQGSCVALCKIQCRGCGALQYSILVF